MYRSTLWPYRWFSCDDLPSLVVTGTAISSMSGTFFGMNMDLAYPGLTSLSRSVMSFTQVMQLSGSVWSSVLTMFSPFEWIDYGPQGVWTLPIAAGPGLVEVGGTGVNGGVRLGEIFGAAVVGSFFCNIVNTCS